MIHAVKGDKLEDNRRYFEDKKEKRKIAELGGQNEYTTSILDRLKK